MKKYTFSLINTSIKLELTVSKLYQLFSEMDTRDKEFWKVLSLEEENHASVLKTAKSIFMISDIFPEELVWNSKEKIEETIKELNLLIDRYSEESSTRGERFNMAYNIEMTEPQLNYQVFMDKEVKDCVNTLLKQLNGSNKKHVEKIMEYIKLNKIEI